MERGFGPCAGEAFVKSLASGAARSVTILVIAALAMSLLPNATAHDDAVGHGSVTILASAAGPEIQFVHCEFFVLGEDLTGDRGTIQATKGFDPRLAEWVGHPDGSGRFEFLAGPFRLPESGLWTITAPFGDGHGPTPATIRYTACDDDGGRDDDCRDTLRAEAREAGTVFLDWDAERAGATYTIHRDGAFLAETHDTHFLDDTSEAGVTYEYSVRVKDSDESCGTVHVTAIPFFPSLVVGALAMVGACGAYAGFRRRS